MADNNQEGVENASQQVDNNPRVENSLPTLRDYAMPTIGVQSAFQRPAI